jgi:hypothetical protein
MDCYIGTKIVQAEPMDAATFGALHSKSPQGTGDGYVVVYEDGYTSWSPKETFEHAYRRVTDAEADLIRGAS